MNIASLVVHTRPDDLDAITGQLQTLPGAEVHASTDNGRLVVTIEHDDTHVVAATLTAIHELQGVISAAITFQYSDDESET